MGNFMHLVEGSSSSSKFMQDLVTWKDARVNPYNDATEREKEEHKEEIEGEKEGETRVGGASIGVETGIMDESDSSDVSRDSDSTGHP